jgi:hypothetical protein
MPVIEKQEITINVLAYQSGERWVAQCVEYDIRAFAEGLPQVVRAFGRSVAANLCVNMDLGRIGLDGIPPAPKNIREAFELSKTTITDESDLAVPVNGITISKMKVAEHL